MDNHGEKFRLLCLEVAQELSRQGKYRQTYSDGEGNRVEGWPIERVSRTDERGNVGGPPGSWWETCLVTNDVFITPEGELLTHYRELYEGTDYLDSLSGHIATDRIQSAGQSVNLVGERGKPFAEWSLKLQRAL